jgi:hypothetical protein
MTAATIYRAANDKQLQDRVMALASKEILYDAALADTAYGKQVAQGFPNLMPLMYPVAVDTEAAYETAVNSGRGAPGHDLDVIPDANLTSAIVAHWPYADGEAPPPPP